MAKKLRITDGTQVTVDDDVYEDVARFRWRRSLSGVVRRDIKKNGKRIPEYLSHRILGVGNDVRVGYRDFDKSNLRRENLRVVTWQQQRIGSRKMKVNQAGNPPSSRYKGVSWHKGKNKWHASACKDYKVHNLGDFDTEEEAAIRYDEFVIEHYGKDARPNFSISDREIST